MCIRDRKKTTGLKQEIAQLQVALAEQAKTQKEAFETRYKPVSYTHLRAHETVLDIVCRLLLEKKKKHNPNHNYANSDIKKHSNKLI